MAAERNGARRGTVKRVKRIVLDISARVVGACLGGADAPVGECAEARAAHEIETGGTLHRRYAAGAKREGVEVHLYLVAGLHGQVPQLVQGEVEVAGEIGGVDRILIAVDGEIAVRREDLAANVVALAGGGEDSPVASAIYDDPPMPGRERREEDVRIKRH